MSTHLPFPLPEPGQEHKLQVGVKDNRVVIGVDERPIAAFSAEQTLTFVAMLCKHLARVMAAREMVEQAIDSAPPADVKLPPPPGDEKAAGN